MRVLVLLAGGSLLMLCGCVGPRPRPWGEGRGPRELAESDRQLIQALAHYGRGLIDEAEQGAHSVDALRHFQAAWRHAPDRHDLGWRVARLALAHGDPQAAIASMERLIEQQPERGALLHHVLAELHALEGDRDASRRHLRRAIERPDALPDSYLDLAASYADESPDEQMDILRAGSARFDHSIRIHYALAYVLAGQNLYRDAAHVFADVHRLAAESAERRGLYLNETFYLHYGAMLERDERYDAATEVFLEGLDLWPDAHRIMNYLAYMWAERDTRLDEALTHVERALAFEPDNGAYIDTRGWILYRQGHFEEALADIYRAHELLGDDPEILEHLGDIHAAMGNHGKALHYWLRGYRIDNDNTDLLGKIVTLGADPDAADEDTE